MNLTAIKKGSRIIRAAPQWVVGLGLLFASRRKPLSCGFFMRKISVYQHAELGMALLGGAGNVKPVVQPTQFGTMIGLMLSSLKPNSRSQS